MKVLFVILLLAVSSPSAFCDVAPDYRICDCEGDCVNVTASGELEVTSSNDNTSVQDCDSTQKDFRISDDDGDVANVTSTGELETA